MAAEFLLGQVLMLGPPVLLAGAGLVYLLVNRPMCPYGVIGLTGVLSLLILLALHGKPYYAGPIYPTLIAAGTVALAGLPGRLGRAVTVVVTVLVVAWGALEFFGPRHGLPRRVLMPHSIIFWRPAPGEHYGVAVTLGIRPEDLGRAMGTVRLVCRFDNPWMVDEERHVPICVAEEPNPNVQDAWAPRKR